MAEKGERDDEAPPSEERQKLFEAEKGGGNVSVETQKMKFAAEGKCLTGSYLTPYCKCNKHKKFCNFIPLELQLPDGILEEHRPYFVPIWLAYNRQCRQSHCFDLDDYPGSSLGSSVGPLLPFGDYGGKARLLMELAKRAIQEYNEKEYNVYKYEVLKIEKVNFSVTAYFQYWMTVKVLNLTLATPIETFQIHAGKSVIYDDDKVIYCCRPKEEAIVGLPSCDICFGMLRGEEKPLGLMEIL